jgi:hypothetical protein
MKFFVEKHKIQAIKEGFSEETFTGCFDELDESKLEGIDEKFLKDIGIYVEISSKDFKSVENWNNFIVTISKNKKLLRNLRYHTKMFQQPLNLKVEYYQNTYMTYRFFISSYKLTKKSKKQLQTIIPIKIMNKFGIEDDAKLIWNQFKKMKQTKN